MCSEIWKKIYPAHAHVQPITVYPEYFLQRFMFVNLSKSIDFTKLESLLNFNSPPLQAQRPNDWDAFTIFYIVLEKFMKSCLQNILNLQHHALFSKDEDT